jgi:hypothetical protein
VPWQQSAQLASALGAVGVPVSLIHHATGVHGFRALPWTLTSTTYAALNWLDGIL